MPGPSPTPGSPQAAPVPALRVFKRIAYNEDLIEVRRREGKPTNYYEDEMNGILWLLDRVGIQYERGETMGIPAHKVPLAPEPEHLSPFGQAVMNARAEQRARHKASVESTIAYQELKCAKKISYTSEEAAGRAIVRLRAEGVDLQTAYPCALCKGWHLTKLDAERSDLARQIAETRKPDPEDLPDEKVAGMGLPSKQIQAQIAARYRKGVSTDDLALDFMLHERLVIRILVDAGFAVSVAQEQDAAPQSDAERHAADRRRAQGWRS
jgi:hypothetical protein